MLRNKQVTDTVLVLYSLSILQFSVVTTKTTDEYRGEEDESDDENVLGESRKRLDSNGNVAVRYFSFVIVICLRSSQNRSSKALKKIKTKTKKIK